MTSKGSKPQFSLFYILGTSVNKVMEGNEIFMDINEGADDTRNVSDDFRWSSIINV